MSLSANSTAARAIAFVLLCQALILILRSGLHYRSFYPSSLRSSSSEATDDHNLTSTLVVSSTKSEDTTWISRELPDISAAIYVADDPQAVYHPPMNKGHESMQYITYIIDHYFGLPDISIFVHAHQYSWHNNIVPDLNMAEMIKTLNLDYVSRVGYFNLRCHEEPGCDGHINLRATEWDTSIPEQLAVHDTWKELHGNLTMPDTLGAPCCSQFAVSREKLLSIPLEKWEFYRNWLVNTNLTDKISGRIWEFTWHYILTGATELCPSVESCYCEAYGVCFGSREAVDTYLLAKDVDWLTNNLKDSLRRKGDTETLGVLDGHWSTSTQLQYGHRLKDAKKVGRERAKKLHKGDEGRG